MGKEITEMRKNTLAFEMYKLKGGFPMPMWKSNLPSDLYLEKLPQVTLMREQFVNFRNSYLLLCEFAQEVLHKKDFTYIDFLEYYNKPHCGDK